MEGRSLDANLCCFREAATGPQKFQPDSSLGDDEKGANVLDPSPKSLREMISGAADFHPWDAMAPAALEAIARRGPFRASAEIGCGGSTIVFSSVSEMHTAFAIEGESLTISALRAWPGFRADTVVFVEGESKGTLPGHVFRKPLDCILLDGPHAYPQPQMEFVHLFEHLAPGGWLVLDDLQIPSVHQLHTFLQRESFIALEEVVVRTAFYRKLDASPMGPDGWQMQRLNRWPVLRYCWRDILRGWLRGKR